MLALAMAGALVGCASAPPPTLSPVAGKPSGDGALDAATPTTKSSKSAKRAAAKVPKTAVPDEVAAIEAGKDACHPISDTYAKEHWRAQNQHGVWRVWVTPVHCDGGGACPTYEVHVTASDGVAGECTQRIALK